MQFLGFHRRSLFLTAGDADTVNLLEGAVALINDNHADTTGTVMLPADEHKERYKITLRHLNHIDNMPYNYRKHSEKYDC